MPDVRDEDRTPDKAADEARDPNPSGDTRPEAGGEDEPKPGLSRRAKIALGVVGALAVVGGGGWGLQAWLHGRLHEATNNAAIQAQTVRVSPMTAGHALRVHVADNQFVEQGQLLVEIDDRDLAVAVEQARAQLAAARGQVAQAQARVAAAQAAAGEARAGVTVAEAEASRATQDFERNRQLTDLATTQQRRDQVVASARTAGAQVDAARGRVSSADAEVRSASAGAASADGELKRAEAALREAELRASYARVVAPFRGHVTQKRVEPGDYVRPGTPVLSLVGEDRWIEANFKETQLTEMRPGQVARVSIDAYPDLELEASVESLQRGTGAQFALLPAQNATGNWVEVVQRLPVKLVFRPGAVERLPPGAVLAPGLSVDVEVRVRDEEPNAALRQAGGVLDGAVARVAGR